MEPPDYILSQFQKFFEEWVWVRRIWRKFDSKIDPATGVKMYLRSELFWPRQLWFLQLLKVEFKMNNFRSNLGGAPAKKNGTWGLFGLDHVWTMFVFFYVPLMTHPGVNQQSTSLEHILTLVSWTNFVHFDCEPGRPRFAFKMNKICSKNNMRRSPV